MQFSLSPLEYFTDPILRGPTWGCMLMCLSASLVGVIAFLRKQSLVGEALSHASFPGVILGVVLAGNLADGDTGSYLLPAMSVLGACIFAGLGLYGIHFLETKAGVRVDSALCFVLSSFFGLGIVLASRIQFTHSLLYMQSMSYLYGQAATMMDIHIWIYGFLSLVIVLAIASFYKEIQMFIFDPDYAKCLGFDVKLLHVLTVALMTLAVVIGIRSVGVVLMSAMLIAPAAAARQFTHRLSKMMVIAGSIGLFSGYLGVFLSVEFTHVFSLAHPGERWSVPTGPMIVMVATGLCLLALFFAPERGVCVRFLRRIRFGYECQCENMLKLLWRLGPDPVHSVSEITRHFNLPGWYLQGVLIRLEYQGWIVKSKGIGYRLTRQGIHRAAHIIRLHRLWELYLADYLGIGIDRVHRSAEEMEHILTPELEKELTELLKDPKFDPHHQPIPPLRGKEVG